MNKQAYIEGYRSKAATPRDAMYPGYPAPELLPGAPVSERYQAMLADAKTPLWLKHSIIRGVNRDYSRAYEAQRAAQAPQPTPVAPRLDYQSYNNPANPARYQPGQTMQQAEAQRAPAPQPAQAPQGRVSNVLDKPIGKGNMRLPDGSVVNAKEYMASLEPGRTAGSIKVGDKWVKDTELSKPAQAPMVAAK